MRKSIMLVALLAAVSAVAGCETQGGRALAGGAGGAVVADAIGAPVIAGAAIGALAGGATCNAHIGGRCRY